MSTDSEKFISQANNNLSITTDDAINTIKGLSNNTPFSTDLAVELEKLLKEDELFYQWLQKKLLDAKLNVEVESLKHLATKLGVMTNAPSPANAQESQDNPEATAPKDIKFVDIAGQSSAHSPSDTDAYRLLDGWLFNKQEDSYHIGSIEQPALITFGGSKTASVNYNLLPDDLQVIEQAALALIDRGCTPIDIFNQPSLSESDNKKLQDSLTNALRKHGYKDEIFYGVEQEPEDINKNSKNEKVEGNNNTQEQTANEKEDNAANSAEPSVAIHEIVDQLSDNELISFEALNKQIEKKLGRNYGIKYSHFSKSNDNYTVCLEKLNDDNTVSKVPLNKSSHARLSKAIDQKPQHTEYLSSNLGAFLVEAMNSELDLTSFCKKDAQGIHLNTYELKNALGSKGLPSTIKKVRFDPTHKCPLGQPLIHANVQFTDKSSGVLKTLSVTATCSSLPFKSMEIGELLLDTNAKLNNTGFANKMNRAVQEATGGAAPQSGDIEEMVDNSYNSTPEMQDNTEYNYYGEDSSSEVPPQHMTEQAPLPSEYDFPPQDDSHYENEGFEPSDWGIPMDDEAPPNQHMEAPSPRQNRPTPKP